MTQEQLVGTALVLRRPARVTAHAVTTGVLAGAVWFLTIVLTAHGTSAPSRRWWLLAALFAGLLALALTVLMVRAATSKVVLSRSRITVVSLTGRRSAPWADVVAVQTARPYLGILGAMPVLKLADSRAVAVDALACRLLANVDHPDRVRIAQYRAQPGLPAVPPNKPVAQPAGPATGGELVIHAGKLNTAPNELRPSVRLLAGRVLLPILLALFAASALWLLAQIGISQWEAAARAAARAGGFGLCAATLVWAVGRPDVLKAGNYRTFSLGGPTDIPWPPAALWVEEAVNLWGTRFVGHLVVSTGGPNAAPVHLWQTSRISPEAFALARVVESY